MSEQTTAARAILFPFWNSLLGVFGAIGKFFRDVIVFVFKPFSSSLLKKGVDGWGLDLKTPPMRFAVMGLSIFLLVFTPLTFRTTRGDLQENIIKLTKPLDSGAIASPVLWRDALVLAIIFGVAMAIPSLGTDPIAARKRRDLVCNFLGVFFGMLSILYLLTIILYSLSYPLFATSGLHAPFLGIPLDTFWKIILSLFFAILFWTMIAEITVCIRLRMSNIEFEKGPNVSLPRKLRAVVIRVPMTLFAPACCLGFLVVHHYLKTFDKQSQRVHVPTVVSWGSIRLTEQDGARIPIVLENQYASPVVLCEEHLELRLATKAGNHITSATFRGEEGNSVLKDTSESGIPIRSLGPGERIHLSLIFFPEKGWLSESDVVKVSLRSRPLEMGGWEIPKERTLPLGRGYLQVVDFSSKDHRNTSTPSDGVD